MRPLAPPRAARFGVPLEAADQPPCLIEHKSHRRERAGRALLNEKWLVRRQSDEPVQRLPPSEVGVRRLCKSRRPAPVRKLARLQVLPSLRTLRASTRTRGAPS